MRRTIVRAVSLTPAMWDEIDTVAQQAFETAQISRLRGWRSYVMRKAIEYGLPAVKSDLERGRGQSGT